VLKDYQIEFLELMLESEALRFGDFTLKSGRKSPYFINAGCFDSGDTIDRLAGFYAKRLADLAGEGLDFDVVFGPAYKGIPLAVATAVAWNRLTGRDVGWCFDRKEEKKHGDRGRLVGAALEDRRVVLVDDVVTAGTSMRHALSLFAEVPGVRTVAALIAVDREEKGKTDRAATVELGEEFGFPVHSIVGIRAAAEYLHANDVGGVRHVDEEAYARLRDYWAEHGAS
jgi:orotate phosphoribosyltransferase